MNNRNNILLAFYGDDFTGSTDALEFICRAGARALLFIEPPTSEQLSAYPNLDAFGVAGMTRSLPSAEMEKVLLPAFEMLKATGAGQVHYKVCSTFDSSPMIGSIGTAIDCGRKIFTNNRIPVIGGTPGLGRYCLFGNLFARLGIGSAGDIYRLDRHPSMSKHPVTPATESDLRLQLGKQTIQEIGLVNLLQLAMPVDQWTGHLKEQETVVLFDVLNEEQLQQIGEWMTAQLKGSDAVFSVGPSSVEMALGLHWNQSGQLTPPAEWAKPGKASPMLVVSGSCSPVTAAQIAYALKNGFEEVIIDINHINSPGNLETVSAEVNERLQQGKNVIAHTGEKQHQSLPAASSGTVLGSIVQAAAEKALIKRVVIAGGDTSSYAARAMEIEAVEMIAPLVSGAPLCRAMSGNKAIHGLEVNFKGGQVGSEDYFEVVLNGALNQ